MRAVAFLAVVALVAGQQSAQCDTPTCFQCQNRTGCGWYTAGPLGNCYLTTNVPSGLNFSLTAAGMCPMCQAGTCMDCQSQNASGCNWYSNSIGALGGTCSNSTPSVGTWSKITQGMCPACTSYTDCGSCTAQENITCGWYTLAGVSSGKCAEASPSFLYSKTNAAFCTGNVCAGVPNCTACQGQLGANNATGVCSWYQPPTPLSAFYNPKCDISSAGIVDSNLYSSVTTCPACQDTSCTACNADTGCQWVGITVLSDTIFGQCISSTATVPTGKKAVTVCPIQCQLYSCTQCMAATGCSWFTTVGTTSLLSDTCDRTTSASSHPLSKIVNGTCPTCRDTRCFECNNEKGCGWYAYTLAGHIVPGSDSCFATGSGGSRTSIPNTDSRCAGSPSSAAVAVPGFVLAVLSLLM